jgi:nicotinamidase-related amidase
VPTILTTVAEKTFSGPSVREVRAAFPELEVIDRTTMNSWEDENVVARINSLGHDRVVLAGLWTSVCIVGPALSALEQGFEVYVIADACGDVSAEAHERAMQRMIQAGARPITSLQYLLELQRDWARGDSYGLTTGIAKQHGGSYGLGIIYAKTMFGASEAEKSAAEAVLTVHPAG